MTENEFETAAGVDPRSTRPFRHDSIYMHPNLARPDMSADLGDQLSELQRTVIAQGELLKRLVDGLEGASRPNSRASARQNDIGVALGRNRG